MAFVRRTTTASLALATFAGAVRMDEKLGDAHMDVKVDGDNDFKALCDEDYVAAAAGVFHGSASGEALTGVAEVQDVLSGTRASIERLWTEGLELETGETLTTGDLCQQVVKALRRTNRLPPSSDIGCFMTGSGVSECSVDLRPAQLEHLTRQAGDLKDYHDEVKQGVVGEHGGAARDDEVDYKVPVAVRKLANVFRIFPATLSLVQGQAAATSSELQQGAATVAVEVRGAEKAPGCSDSYSSCAQWARDGECPKMSWYLEVCAKSCSEVMEVKDTFAKCSEWATGTRCKDDSELFAACPASCSGCGTKATGGEINASPQGPVVPARHSAASMTVCRDEYASSCAGWKDECSTSKFVAEKCQKTCGGCSFDWVSHMAKVNVLAVGYLSTALNRFQKYQTGAAIRKWYGPDAYTDGHLRKKLRSIMNSVDNMLGNVVFAMGPQCSPKTYAYVYPSAEMNCASSELQTKKCTKDNEGHFIFYLCQLTLDSPVAEQIETLIHEGSHHQTARTNDVTFDGNKAYGRSTCARMAGLAPWKAIQNADNFCYYIQDVTDGVQE